MALTSDQQKQLQSIKERALELKGVIDERARNEKNTSSSSSSRTVTSSSRDAVNEEDGLRAEIEKNLRDQQKDIDRQIERERRALEQRREQERSS